MKKVKKSIACSVRIFKIEIEKRVEYTIRVNSKNNGHSIVIEEKEAKEMAKKFEIEIEDI